MVVFSPFPATLKEECPPGYYSEAGWLDCLPCEPGYFCEMASTSPTPPGGWCPAGGYCPDGRLFIKCPSGTYNPTSGSFSPEACVACPPGE